MIEAPANLTFTRKVHFKRSMRGQKEMAVGTAPAPNSLPPGRVPRIARLMALAIRFDGLIRSGQIADYAELARLGHVTRARATQIMNLLNLAPDIQEAILHLPSTERGRDTIREWQLRPIAAEPNWRLQRWIWHRLSKMG